MTRRTLIVAVVALRFAGQQDMPDVVIVIIPLPAIFATWRVLRGVQQACAVVAVFEHEMDVTVALRGKLADRDAEIAQDRDLARFNDGIDRIKPQPLETILAQP